MSEKWDILKSKDVTLPTKVCMVKAMVFPAVRYGCESWTIKKAEHQRIDAFELWCWRRLLRVPWTARRSNQSILKEMSPEYSLERLMLKRKLQYFVYLMQRTDHLKRPWCWKRLKAGREGDDRGWDGWMASPTQWTWIWTSSGSWWWTGRPGMMQSMRSQRVGNDWATELNWYLFNYNHQINTAFQTVLWRNRARCLRVDNRVSFCLNEDWMNAFSDTLVIWLWRFIWTVGNDYLKSRIRISQD